MLIRGNFMRKVNLLLPLSIAFTNFFITPNFISMGGSSILFGSTGGCWMPNRERWKTIPLCWRLLLEESIKVSISSRHTLSPLIWLIQQCCYNKSMMSYPRTWKTDLILTHGINTSRTLFLMPIDVFLWDMNSAADQTHRKGLHLVSGRWVLLVLTVLAGRPLLACMRHPQLQKSCHYVWNQSYILLSSGSRTGRSGT